MACFLLFSKTVLFEDVFQPLDGGGDLIMNKREKRQFARFKPSSNILVKEDNGSIINYYHVGDISLGGMYLQKKISSNEESKASYTFLVPECNNPTVNGEIIETRESGGVYGTAIKFNEEPEQLVHYISKASGGE
jgi:hypothetical protein